MKPEIDDQKLSAINFAVSFTAALDEINREEAANQSIMACLTVLLMELGYTPLESHGSAIALGVLIKDGLSNACKPGCEVACLASFLTTCIRMIDEKNIPEFILDVVRTSI